MFLILNEPDQVYGHYKLKGFRVKSETWFQLCTSSVEHVHALGSDDERSVTGVTESDAYIGRKLISSSFIIEPNLPLGSDLSRLDT